MIGENTHGFPKTSFKTRKLWIEKESDLFCVCIVQYQGLRSLHFFTCIIVYDFEMNTRSSKWKVNISEGKEIGARAGKINKTKLR